MNNSYYVQGGQRAARVRTLFGRIAPRYDLINDCQSFGLHRLWKRQVLAMANLRPEDKVLDLCCGTGDLSLALTRQGCWSAGLDFSEPMLRVAQERSKQIVQPLNHWILGDALNLPFLNESFDVVAISYGLRNLADFERGISEMVRVLKPLGRLLVLDFGLPSNALWRVVYTAYLRWLVPCFGALFCGDRQAYAYILDSLYHYPRQQGVAELMKKASLGSVRIHDLLGGVMSIHYGVKPRTGEGAGA